MPSARVQLNTTLRPVPCIHMQLERSRKFRYRQTPIHATLINLSGVHLSLGEGDQRRKILDNIFFNLSPGELHMLVGPNGCGKVGHMVVIGCERCESYIMQHSVGDVKLLDKILCECAVYITKTNWRSCRIVERCRRGGAFFCDAAFGYVEPFAPLCFPIMAYRIFVIDPADRLASRLASAWLCGGVSQ
jgi:hypothetical protein